LCSFRSFPSYSEIEFWSGKPSRLHDRVRYTRQTPASAPDAEAEAAWTIERLAP
jgi:pyridoxamine 5'-phosphate oxidase